MGPLTLDFYRTTNHWVDDLQRMFQELPRLRGARKYLTKKLYPDRAFLFGMPRMLHFCLQENEDNKTLIIGATREHWLDTSKAENRTRSTLDDWALAKRGSRWTSQEEKSYLKGRETLWEKIFGEPKLRRPKEINRRERVIEAHRRAIQDQRNSDNYPDPRVGRAIALKFPTLEIRDRCIICLGETEFEECGERGLRNTIERGFDWTPRIYDMKACAEFITCIMNGRVLRTSQTDP